MQKDKKTELTKEKLIAAADKLISEADDPFKVTSRQIAKESGMQAAMINYCFGSREKLIYDVFYIKYRKALENERVLKIVQSTKLTPKDKLKQLHYIVAKFLINDFKYTSSVTSFILYNRDLSQESFSYRYVKEHFRGTKTDAECRLIAYELSTMMQLIIYRKDDFKNHMKIDLTKDRQLKHYIDLRVDLLLPEIGNDKGIEA